MKTSIQSDPQATSPSVSVSNPKTDWELRRATSIREDPGTPSSKLTWHLKMDGWNFSFLDGLFSGAMLVSGSVPSSKLTYIPQI